MGSGDHSPAGLAVESARRGRAEVGTAVGAGAHSGDAGG